MVLSNSAQSSDVTGSFAQVEFRPSRPDEVPDALRLILGGPAGLAPDEQVGEFLQFAHQRGIDLQQMWVIGSGGRMGWAILPIVSPGRTMLLFTPTQRPRGIDVGPMIEALCNRFAQQGVHLAQALVDPSDMQGRQLYAAHGFREMAELIYLQAAVRRTAPPQLPDGLSWQTYSSDVHAAFAQAILDSYQQSLDCPALNGLRAIEDIIAGHKASGEFDLRFWFVLTGQSGAVGVVLLNRVSRSDMAELVYFGLSPAWRGRGLGDLMLRHAMWAVRQMNLNRLTLAVDSRNAPALKLYYRHGLQQVGSKTALMRDLRSV
ncbi:MAG TPA: GNAT family N-acetyltransferase [Tepidisphaeraceae bacterium]|nr:GNAT family N-acetyltransferase [Tepidisphaeraceae bacterium]